MVGSDVLRLTRAPAGLCRDQVSALKKQIEDLSTKEPELQRAKQLAVTGRNFKEASRIAAELKDLGAHLAEKKEALSQAEAEVPRCLRVQQGACAPAPDTHARPVPPCSCTRW